MNYSLEKIAAELGISKSTVSLILNGHARENRISTELEKTVKDFCKKINYAPNIHAIRASSKLVKNIGLLINEELLTDKKNPFSDQNTAEITGGVVSAAAKKGFRVTMQFYNKNSDESEIFKWLRDREIDGVIYYGYIMNKNWLDCFKREKRRIVGIGIEPAQGMSTVNINNADSSYALCDYLVKKGRRNFLYVAGYEYSYVSNQRLSGLKKCMSDNKISFDEKNIVYANFSEDDAYKIIADKDTGGYDAIVCANDDMAIGVIKALSDKKISVPSDISVTGADNIKLSEYFSPSISTFDNMNSSLGKKAFGELYNLINGKKSEDIVIKSKIYIRETC